MRDVVWPRGHFPAACDGRAAVAGRRRGRQPAGARDAAAGAPPPRARARAPPPPLGHRRAPKTPLGPVRRSARGHGGASSRGRGEESCCRRARRDTEELFFAPPQPAAASRHPPRDKIKRASRGVSARTRHAARAGPRAQASECACSKRVRFKVRFLGLRVIRMRACQNARTRSTATVTLSPSRLLAADHLERRHDMEPRCPRRAHLRPSQRDPGRRGSSPPPPCYPLPEGSKCSGHRGQRVRGALKC